ncbi:hypothetical protein JTF06_02770 [Desemzia sp. RIT804]|uniref:hypothetical protein n=1 Tax=Desemzia sp. RIT 804 TaxID=2810209 RepID=UPI00194ECCBF|nr:hypothetical protein [Desemzia sp. RIT 804]MBM6613816.1 hypothetical protein [Desemzia sp. RIT 804]
MTIKTTIQTVLNFFALNIIFNPIANAFIPINGVGVLLSFFYWGVLVLSAYAVTLFLSRRT